MALERGQTEFAVGRTKAAQATLNGVAEIFRKRGMPERADSILAAMPRAEAELGLATTALAQLERLPAELSESDTALPVAWAWVGETAKADALLTRTLAAHPGDTLLEEDAGPQVRAAIAIHEQKPQEAVDALQVALPYDLRSFDVPVLRGRAYLALKQPAQAEAEFHKVLDHPGIEPLSYNYALAQLGVARALAQQGKLEEAGFAYKVLLQIWKEADSDLPRLHEAQAEYGRLFTTPARKTIAAVSHPAAKPRKR
jgi:tetratricopeptide (TPR) repeat protein